MWNVTLLRISLAQILIPHSTTCQVKGADYAVLDSYCRFVTTAGKALGINIGGKWVCIISAYKRVLVMFCYFCTSRVALPTRIQKFTVLKSPHIYKKHRVQYEIRTHSRLMQVQHVYIHYS